MKEFALLGDGNPEQLAEENDCLVNYIGKMVELQLNRKDNFQQLPTWLKSMQPIQGSSMLLCRGLFEHPETCMHVSGNLA